MKKPGEELHSRQAALRGSIVCITGVLFYNMKYSLLAIDGVQTEFNHEFSLRAYNPNGVGPPADFTLYKNGKRVTKSWRLTLVLDQPADPHGGNANTE